MTPAANTVSGSWQFIQIGPAKAVVLLGLVFVFIGAVWIFWSVRHKKPVDGQLVELRAAKSLMNSGITLIMLSVVYAFTASLLVRALAK